MTLGRVARRLRADSPTVVARAPPATRPTPVGAASGGTPLPEWWARGLRVLLLKSLFTITLFRRVMSRLSTLSSFRFRVFYACCLDMTKFGFCSIFEITETESELLIHIFVGIWHRQRQTFS